MAASFLEIRLLMGTVDFLTTGFLAGLGKMGRVFGQILPMFLFFVNDFLVVGNVSGVGHHTL